ncbi:MAG: hypothetical protein WC551_04250 [Patescibacteria group bacterium]
MSADISLLPEGLRKKEEALKSAAPTEPPKEPGTDMRFFIPQEEGEDIEVIEVDEGEIDQVLAGEPALTKFAFYATSLFDDLKSKLFKPKPIVAPPKAPPQFFKAPPPKAPGQVPAPAKPGTMAPIQPAGAMPVAGAATAGPSLLPTVGGETAKPAVPGMAQAKTKASIAPFPVAPRRVRVIKRVRKPLRVSFVSEEEVRMMHVDVRKRRFTFVLMAVLFLVLLGGGYGLLDYQKQQAQAGYDQATAQVAEVNGKISQQLKMWSAFQNLEPKLKTLAGLLDKHVSPTRLLQDLENNTLPTVAYESFSLSEDKKVNLAVSADSLESAAKQLVAFKTAKFIKTVEASNYAIDYDPKDKMRILDVKFQVVLTLSDDALNLLAAEPAD